VISLHIFSRPDHEAVATRDSCIERINTSTIRFGMERDPPAAGVDGAYKVLNAFNTVVAARLSATFPSMTSNTHRTKS
jgi:hypothetical protein